MRSAIQGHAAIDRRIAERLRNLRAERGWTLEARAERCSICRATLSRLENAEVSATASVLNRVCAAYGLTMSRLMRLVEEDFPALVPAASQTEWRDPSVGFRRRSISPPAGTLAGEALECRIEPDTRIAYDAAPRSGLEHHLLLLEGALAVTVGGETYDLRPGDCLRYQLFGESAFRTGEHSPARYVLFMV
jgi:transcriptional regulator with XRE-family HTH domain